MGYSGQFTGGPRVIINLFAEMNRNLIDPVLIADRESPMVDSARKLGVTVEVCPVPASLDFRNNAALTDSWTDKIRNLFEMRKYNSEVLAILKRHGCQGLWVRNVRGVLLAGASGKKLGVPVIWDIGMEKEVRGALKTVLFSRALSIADAIVTEAKNVADQVFLPWQRKYFRSKFRIINPGILTERVEELDRYAGGRFRHDDSFKILCPATINPRKNQMLLLRTANRLKNKIKGLKILFAGPSTDEAYAEQTKKFIEQNQLTSVVELLGWRDDVPELMGQSNLMVICSRNEGVPQAVLESFHSRLPVIGTVAGGIPDVIADGKTGFLVNPDDDLLLEKRIMEIYNSPELGNRIATEAKKFVSENYNLAKWCRETEKLICSLADRPFFTDDQRADYHEK